MEMIMEVIDKMAEFMWIFFVAVLAYLIMEQWKLTQELELWNKLRDNGKQDKEEGKKKR